MSDGTLRITSVHTTWIGLLFVMSLSGGLLWFRKQRKPGPNDAWLTSSSWTPLARLLVPCLVVVCLILPIFVFIMTFVFGAFLALAEAWTYDRGFEYVLGNIVGLQIVSDTPLSTFGKFVDVIISIWVWLLFQGVLGLAVNLKCMDKIADAIPANAKGLALALLVVFPLCMLLLSFITGMVLAAIEDWTVGDGFLFMVGRLCGIMDPLTAVAPDSKAGIFFTSILFVVELGIGGCIIAIVAAHPSIVQLMGKVEGSKEETASDADATDGTEGKAPTQEATSQQEDKEAAKKPDDEKQEQAQQPDDEKQEQAQHPDEQKQAEAEKPDEDAQPPEVKKDDPSDGKDAQPPEVKKDDPSDGKVEDAPKGATKKKKSRNAKE